ncbi:glycosyltransferase family 2 protein [Pseudoalteromonas aurantia]|uniref:Alpha-1,6-rhamnosyltransferase n=1 Tax=Pseudoalteromonas aurantia 208 TaxID=1314867 RepID=A0ABR9EFU5_9GAMM|nr:glycosyltransferase family 2 protein [Pseudoalteromonas aurantia]MBE0369274.1 alpha-1,6-rhamnosyltransferase [Pseudoalteromonas aurantia 208]
MRGTKNAVVSVLMPCYNASGFLEKSIKSVISQSYGNIELLCVDDGSTDNTLDILNSLSSKHEQIKVFTKENGGASSARNLALKHANGDYICMVDADDALVNDAIELLLKAIIQADADAGLFDLYYWDGDLNENKFKQVPIKGSVTGVDATELSLDWSIHGVAMYRAGLFSDIRYDESNLHGDELTTRELFLLCKKIAFSSARYLYRQHDDSSTKSFSMARFGLLENQLKLKELLSKQGVYERMKPRFCAQFMLCVWSAYILMYEHKSRMQPEQIQQVECLIHDCLSIIKQIFSSKVLFLRPIYLRLLTSTIFYKGLLRAAATLFILTKRIMKR